MSPELSCFTPEITQCVSQQASGIHFRARVPSDFSGIFKEVSSAVHTLAPETAISKKVRATRAINLLFEDMGVDCSYPEIVSNSNRLTLFHLSPNPDSVIKDILEHRLTNRRNNSTKWGSNCFGQGLNCFTDKRLVRSKMIAENLGINNVIAIETTGMQTEHKVVVKQGYFAYMVDMALNIVNSYDPFSTQFKMIIDEMQNVNGAQTLNKSVKQHAAFYLSGLIIDAYCALHPSESRLSFRQTLDKKFRGGGILSGYRSPTDEIYLEKSTLLEMVRFVISERGMDDKLAFSTMEAITHVVDKILSNPSEYWEDPYTNWTSTGVCTTDLERLLLFRIAMGGEEQLLQYLHQNILPSNSELFQLFDGWFPNQFASATLTMDEAIGTDLGSNNVAILGRFNSEKHRILTQEEKVNIFSHKF